jgi:hypothetical protein
LFASDQELAIRPEDPPRLVQHAPVLIVCEVAKRREPADHAVEAAIGPRQRAHVALDVFDLEPACRRLCSCALQEQRRCVEAGHAGAPRGQPIRDTTVSAA